MPVSIRMTIVFLILLAITMPVAAVCSAKEFEESISENNIAEIESVMYSRLAFLDYENINENDYKALLNRDWAEFVYYGECSESLSEEYMYSLLRVCFETNYEFHPEIVRDSQTKEIDLTAKLFSVYFSDESGRLLLCADSSLVSSPVEYIYNDKVSAAYYSVMETAEPVFIERFIGMYNQMYSCYLVPIKDECGNTVGIYELNWTFEENRQKTNEFVFDFVIYCTGVMVIVSIIIIIMMMIFVYPLKDMNKKAIMLAEGNTGVKTAVRGNNDISSLCMAFNYYSESIHKNISKFKLLNQAYKYYIPEKILEIFGKSRVSDIDTGNKCTANIYIVFMKLFVNEVPYENRRLKSSLNEIFESIVPMIESYGGTVLQYEHNVIPIIYTKEDDSAVRCAIAVSQTINSTFKKYNASVCSVISFENISFEVVGNKEIMRIELKGENLEFISVLADMADKLGTGIIVTDKVSEKSENFFSVFSTRYMGIYNDNIGNAVKIYDVFDGDELYSKNMKRMTKEDFESAVELYTIGRYDMARNTFTNILKSYTDDKVSIYYISECGKGENKT